MATKFGSTVPREKQKITRKGRHSKRVKARDRKQTFFTQGACRG